MLWKSVARAQEACRPWSRMRALAPLYGEFEYAHDAMVRSDTIYGPLKGLCEVLYLRMRHRTRRIADRVICASCGRKKNYSGP